MLARIEEMVTDGIVVVEESEIRLHPDRPQAVSCLAVCECAT